MDLQCLMSPKPPSHTLWQGEYKIPWNEPEFSKRMLAIHLDQECDLASRRKSKIKEQVDWLQTNLFTIEDRTILDLGCGPALYLKEFAERGHACRGIDFSPASVAHGAKLVPSSSSIELGDIRQVDYGPPVCCVTLLYGELDVFSPSESKTILDKARKVLSSGGKLIIEAHRLSAVRKNGQAENSWYKCDRGLFLDGPHVCLIENHWYDEEQTSLQRFFVMDISSSSVTQYRSTTLGRTKEQYAELLTSSGFTAITIHDDWPQVGDHFQLISAQVA